MKEEEYVDIQYSLWREINEALDLEQANILLMHLVNCYFNGEEPREKLPAKTQAMFDTYKAQMEDFRRMHSLGYPSTRTL